MKCLYHIRNTFQNKKIQAYLDKYPPEHWLEYYGKFWLLMEVLALNKNSIHPDHIGQLTYEYCGYIDSVGISDDDIEIMVESGVVSIDANGNIYSGFQKMVLENKQKTGKAKMKLDILEKEIETKEKLLKRLNDKVEFVKQRANKPVLLKGRNNGS